METINLASISVSVAINVQVNGWDILNAFIASDKTGPGGCRVLLVLLPSDSGTVGVLVPRKSPDWSEVRPPLSLLRRQRQLVRTGPVKYLDIDHDGNFMMDFNGDDIAEVVQTQFERLPQKRKPQTRGDGVQEWVPLSGIVAQGFWSRDAPYCLLIGS